MTGHSDEELAVVDAAALNRPRSIPLSALRPCEALHRRRPPRSGYAPPAQDHRDTVGEYLTGRTPQ